MSERGTHPPLSLEAPAKVNLGLEILRRRPDGFHDIETIFCTIALTDTVELTLRDRNISMECTHAALPTDSSNLCIRAADALRRETGKECGVHIVLKKRIPHGAGLGGGSSDAAAVLKGLLNLWNVHMSAIALADLAVGLGSDVPFFLDAGISFGYGRGEKLDRLPNVFPYWIVCVVPPVQIATSWVYANHTVKRRTSGPNLRDRFTASVGDLKKLEAALTNDFEEGVVSAVPAVRHTLEALRAQGLRCVMMSGSGSSVFGLTPDSATALRSAGSMPADHVVSITPPRSAP